MKQTNRRIASVLVAAATMLSVGALSGAEAIKDLPLLGTSASAAASKTYVNTSGAVKSVTSYSKITSSTTKLTGGWYVVSGKVTIDDRIRVTDDTYLILEDGAKLVVKGGINVASGVKFNVYSQEDSAASLYAGTTNGSNTTAAAGYCGIGGRGAKVNIVGGNVYASGGSGASGMYGEEIHLYWSNPSDSIYSSGYNGKVTIYDTFADITKGNAYKSVVVNSGSVAGSTLVPAYTIDENTTELEDGTYAIFDSVNVKKRMNVTGDVNIVLAKNSSLKAQKGITVSTGNALTIDGQGQLLAGTSTASNFLADSNSAGIGSDSRNDAGSITVNGGTVYANGGSYAAGIGGGNSYVSINGGKVYANGGTYGAGIGSGYSDNGADIRINGGNVQAKGGSNGAGIGSGYGSSRSAITLSYTNSNDSIYANSYSGNVQYLKTMYTSDGQIANANNISGKTLSSALTGYTVSFVTNGGTSISPVVVNPGSYLSNLPTPQRTGYTFVGWYTDSALTRSFNTNTRINSNVTLYAGWSTTATVYFESNGGSAVNPVNVQIGSYMVQSPDSPYKYGYTFAGWYTDARLTTPFDYRYTRINGTMTLYAKWTDAPAYFTVRFNSNGGSAVNAMNVTYGTKLYQNSLPVPSRSGYTFDGWYEDSACTIIGGAIDVRSNITLYAGWTRNTIQSYTVSFNSNGGSSVSAMSVTPGTILYQNSLPVPTRSGYAFTGWYEDSACSIIGGAIEITANTTLYAGWERTAPQSYTVSFNSNGGSSVSPLTVNEGFEIIQSNLPIPSRTGYQFTYWYTDSALRNIAGGDKVYNNITLYAGWERTAPQSYTVSFNSNGGSSVDPLTVNEGFEIIQSNLPIPSRTGYEFTYWYTDSALRNIAGGDRVYNNITLYAGWSKTATPSVPTNPAAPSRPGLYTVTFDAAPGYFPDGRTVISFEGGNNDVISFSDFGFPILPAGYTFECWEDEYGNALDGSEIRITGNAYYRIRYSSSYTGSTFGGAGLIAAIVGGVVVVGGGVAAGVAVSRKKKQNGAKEESDTEKKD